MSLIWISVVKSCCVCARKYQGKPPRKLPRRNSTADQAIGTEKVRLSGVPRSNRRIRKNARVKKSEQQNARPSQVKYMRSSATRIHCRTGTKKARPPAHTDR